MLSRCCGNLALSSSCCKTVGRLVPFLRKSPRQAQLKHIHCHKMPFEERSMESARMEAQKAFAPAADRNKSYIADAIADLVPDGGQVLELASGTGQHIAHFADRFPATTWQPSDLTSELFASIQAHCLQSSNVLQPIIIDASASEWKCGGPYNLVICTNMTHISPWEATQGLVRGAAANLVDGGALYIYGPFLRDGKPTTESNAAFDASLKARNPLWGLRDIADISELAVQYSLQPVSISDMPANNFSLVFRKGSALG